MKSKVIFIFVLVLFPSSIMAQGYETSRFGNFEVVHNGNNGYQITYEDTKDGITIKGGCNGNFDPSKGTPRKFISSWLQVTTTDQLDIATYQKHFDAYVESVFQRCENFRALPNLFFVLQISEPPAGYGCASNSCILQTTSTGTKRDTKLKPSKYLVPVAHMDEAREDFEQALAAQRVADAEKEKAQKERTAKRLAEEKRLAEAENVDIRDFEDVIPILIEGQFASFKHYTKFMDYFHQDYLAAYSEACGTTIKPAEVRTLSNVVTTSIDGVDTGSRQLGKTQTIRIEPRFATQYDSKLNAENRFFVSKYGLNTSSIVGVWQINRSQAVRFLRRNPCGSEKSKILLDNLYRYATGKEPLNDS